MIDINCLLCVEDDSPNRLVMKLLVEKTLHLRNYAVFEDSKDFLPRVRNLPVKPDIILLDIHVSPLNGFKMLQMIREDSVYGDTKVVHRPPMSAREFWIVRHHLIERLPKHFL